MSTAALSGVVATPGMLSQRSLGGLTSPTEALQREESSVAAYFLANRKAGFKFPSLESSP